MRLPDFFQPRIPERLRRRFPFLEAVDENPLYLWLTRQAYARPALWRPSPSLAEVSRGSGQGRVRVWKLEARMGRLRDLYLAMPAREMADAVVAARVAWSCANSRRIFCFMALVLGGLAGWKLGTAILESPKRAEEVATFLCVAGYALALPCAFFLMFQPVGSLRQEYGGLDMVFRAYRGRGFGGWVYGSLEEQLRAVAVALPVIVWVCVSGGASFFLGWIAPRVVEDGVWLFAACYGFFWLLLTAIPWAAARCLPRVRTRAIRAMREYLPEFIEQNPPST